MSDSDLDVAMVVGLGAGVFLFFKGFRVYREYRVLEDTPETPIRSIAMGLVHIHGKARGDHLVPSPVSQTPCFFYKVDIEKWKTNSKGGGSWAHYKTDANGVPFYLEDSSGKVLVDAHRAEYDLIQTVKRETGRGLGSLTRLLSDKPDPALVTGVRVTDDDLMSYAESAASIGGGASVLGSLGQLAIGGGLNISLGGGSGSSRRYRFTECCILPDHWYDVAGTCAENPAPQDEHDRNMIRKGENEPTFLISWRAEKEIERTLRNRAALYVFGGGALSVVCLGGLLFRLGWL
jgi:hypothetical protein